MSSKKDPAVLFYTDDFLSGTILMSYEQKGKYITLLCLQHQKGRLTEKELLTVCGGYEEDIFSKFVIDENGKYYNVRMETESEKRRKYSESRSENRKKTKKTPSDCCGETYVQTYEIHTETYDAHMGNGNENINENIGIVSSNGNKRVSKGNKRVFVPPTYEEVLEYAKSKGQEDLAQRFFDYFNEGDWIDSQGNKVRNWKQKFLTWCTREEKKPVSEKKTQVRYGTFDPDEAFQNALQRSYQQEEQEIEQYVI